MDCMRNAFVAGVLLDGRYRTISPLNHGSFGMVFKALDTFTNDFVALKCLTKAAAGNVCPSAIAIDDKSEELGLHRRIGNHANVVNLLGSFETPNHIYLVLEFCSNGDLYEAIRLGRGPLQTEHVRDFMFQLIGAIEHMHKNGVYHRDIKPENIFLTQNGTMKLGDFGLATRDTWSMEAAVGSDRYMAPEQYDPTNNGYAPATADIWSIGICLLNVLFSRNPFATPTASDPLYRDFVADRQTLFDVFPTMSQDTWEILIHCLAIDPANRSLNAAKEALKRVVSFTTDDESLDDFCTDDRSVALATANREPFRTPSISATPLLEQGGAFPWAKALAMSPPQQIRQLSAIPDADFSEPLFPSSEDESRDWASSKPDSASIASFVDSGLGVSVKTSSTMQSQLRGEPIKIQRSKPVPISGSLPISAARPIPSLANVFKRDTMSKSWSDMYEEDEEEAANSDIENSTSFGFGGPLKAIKSKDWGYESSDGRSTPRNRVGLSEMNASTVNNSRNRSPQTIHREQEVDEHISEHTGFIFEDLPMTPTKPRKSDFLDKWAKLGARRRAEEPKSGSTSGSLTPKQSTATKREAGSVQQPRKRSQTRVGSWRGRRKDTWVQHSNGSDQWNGVSKDGQSIGTLQSSSSSSSSSSGKEWRLSKDWRQHSPTQTHRQHSYHSRHHFHDMSGGGLGGDLEWVWRTPDLHL